VPISTTFQAGPTGEWRIETIAACGKLSPRTAAKLTVADGLLPPSEGAAWALRGHTSNLRYTTRTELTALDQQQAGLGRAEARYAALIPIRKSAEWWDLAQDERREIIASQSQHMAIGLDYIPAIARRLFHCRDLGEPFDFLTWFEFAPEHTAQFDTLLVRLRETPEWRYVEHEVDIRLTRAD
jgi:chlorite dismutase